MATFLSTNISAAAVGCLAKLMAPPTEKVKVSDFQLSWTEDFGFFFQKDRAVCTVCFKNVVCRTYSVKHYLETKQERTLKDNADKAESIRVQCPGMGSKQISSKSLSPLAIALLIASQKLGKPFTVALMPYLKACQTKKVLSQE